MLPCNVKITNWVLTPQPLTADVKLYNLKHNRCPKCGSSKVMKTSISVPHTPGKRYIDRINQYVCPCGSFGKLNKLKPIKIK